MNLNFASIWENISSIIPDQTAIVCGDKKRHGQSMTI